MQVILGAGGAIGNDLARELKKYTAQVRLVSRNPEKVNDDDELLAGDLTDGEFADKAVAGSEVAYITVGLQYNIQVWRAKWPVIMQNVISSCKKHNTKLVFFDNMYMYDKNKLNPMTEETEIQPSSEKGKVRAQIAEMLLNEVKSGKLQGLIARAADFYGPGIGNSVLNEAVVNNLKKRKKAIWFGKLNHLHNFTYTPDAAMATALLGNTPSAYGEVWHLPTVQPLTMREWINRFAAEIGTKPNSMVIPKFMIILMGFINPLMKETTEMLYQYDRNYNFDSSKFETVFNVKPTQVETAIHEIVKAG